MNSLAEVMSQDEGPSRPTQSQEHSAEDPATQAKQGGDGASIEMHGVEAEVGGNSQKSQSEGQETRDGGNQD